MLPHASNKISDKQDQIKADAKEEADAMKNNEGKKEILKNLVEIITKAYDADNETRAMIFVQTRQMALYLSNYLNNCSALKRFKGAEGLSSHFTSTNIQRVHGGTSKSEQEKIIDTFAGGQFISNTFNICNFRPDQDPRHYFSRRRGFRHSGLQLDHQIQHRWF